MARHWATVQVGRLWPCARRNCPLPKGERLFASLFSLRAHQEEAHWDGGVSLASAPRPTLAAQANICVHRRDRVAVPARQRLGQSAEERRAEYRQRRIEHRRLLTRSVWDLFEG